jgi:hypothetical protein
MSELDSNRILLTGQLLTGSTDQDGWRNSRVTIRRLVLDKCGKCLPVGLTHRLAGLGGGRPVRVGARLTCHLGPERLRQVVAGAAEDREP